jgi:hypothetical protein
LFPRLLLIKKDSNNVRKRKKRGSMSERERLLNFSKAPISFFRVFQIFPSPEPLYVRYLKRKKERGKRGGREK